MLKATIWFMALVVGAGLFGQAVEKGAKAIFLDTQTGRMTMPMQARPAAARQAAKAQAGSVQVPAITGLMYYLELLEPSGQLVRVNSTRTFHSGDKVRLHVSSNVDGSLVILQRQDQGAFERLFPAASMPTLAAFVKKGVDTVLPTASGWFKFDERPGEIHLLMMLTAAAESSRPAPVSFDDRAEMMLAFNKIQHGSKGLMVEADDSPKNGYEVRLVDSTRDKTLTPGQIVVEVKLQHRPRT